MEGPLFSLNVYSGCTNRTFTTVRHKVIKKQIFLFLGLQYTLRYSINYTYIYLFNATRSLSAISSISATVENYISLLGLYM